MIPPGWSMVQFEKESYQGMPSGRPSHLQNLKRLGAEAFVGIAEAMP
jgi:hypothetical protein